MKKDFNLLDTREKSVYYNMCFAGMAELADAPDLGSGGRPCRFKSCYPHGIRVFEMSKTFQRLCFFAFDSNWEMGRHFLLRDKNTAGNRF